MASGRATIPTMIPAIRSAEKVDLSYPFRQESNLGLNSNDFINDK
jgi:hypothetical protein